MTGFDIMPKLIISFFQCKRTTDVIVEKERAFRQLKETQNQLVKEGKKFHDLRIPFLLPSLQAHVQLQVSIKVN